MGNEYSGGNIRTELQGSRKVAGYNPGQLKTLREKFVLMCDDDLSIDLKSFSEIIRIKDEEAAEIFKLFDADGSGKIDSYEFICGITLLSHTSLKQKAEIIFGLFDFDESLELNKDELIVLSRCVVCALLSMSGKKTFPTISEIDKKLNAILTKYDLQNLQNISLLEFQSLISKDPDILNLLKAYNFVLSDDLREIIEDDKVPVQCDSDVDEEVNFKSKVENATENHRNVKGIDPEITEDRIRAALKYKSDFVNDSYKPNYFSSVTEDKRSPEVNIEPLHVFGYRGFDMRNSIKPTPTAELVLFSGKTAVVYNKKSNSQKIFQYHTQEISCMASFESYFATGEFGEDPAIHVWDSKTLQVKFTLQGILKKGVSHLKFSHDGKKLAAVEISSNHTVVIYDFGKLLAGKATDFKEQVLGIYKGPDKVSFSHLGHLRHGVRRKRQFLVVRLQAESGLYSDQARVQHSYGIDFLERKQSQPALFGVPVPSSHCRTTEWSSHQLQDCHCFGKCCHQRRQNRKTSGHFCVQRNSECSTQCSLWIYFLQKK
jgi:Ca2+-binding EF-hand superfamily protein